MQRKSFITALLASAMYLSGTTAGAANVQFSGVTAFGGLYTSSIVSMQEAKYANVIRQETDYSCGAAALATILKYGYGMDATEEVIMQGMLNAGDAEIVRRKGFSMLDMKRYVGSLGLRGRGYRLTEERLKRLKIPVIVLMDIDGYRHFSVLKRIHDGEAFLADPVLGNKVMDLEAFRKAWANRVIFAVIGSGFDRNTALLKMPFRLSANQWLEKQAAIPDSELLDFGFTHTDLF